MTLTTLLIDMDGPLADFDRAFYTYCGRNGYAMHNGTVDISNRCTEHRFATDCITNTGNKRRARTHVDRSHWFASLPPTEGAIEGINLLAEHPDVNDVFICTKPMEANPHCRDDKAEWVNDFLGREWVRRLIITPDKGMVRGDVLLDDAPKPHWFERAEWRPVIFPTPWNAPDTQFSRKNRLDDEPRWSWERGPDRLVNIAKIHTSERIAL
jgi:5'-nucleotidase